MSTFTDLLTYCNQNNTTLVAVSKTKPMEAITELYNEGQRIFGENRVPELVEKYNALPKDIKWHMIGHLQTNKVKNIAPFVQLIHSGDRISLLKEVNKAAKKNDRIIDILLQLKIAKEETKSGWDKNELYAMLTDGILDQYENLNIRGVMGMATFTDNQTQIEEEFAALKTAFDKMKLETFPTKKDFDVISMGMSGDYKIAIQEGSTMIRVGSLLFGAR